MSDISTIPGELNITIYKGDTLYKTLTFTDANDDPLDLSTCTVTMQVRRKAGETVLISLTEGDGLTVSSNTVLIDHLVTIAKGSYLWDLQFEYDSGIVRTYVGGSFDVENDITRAE
jgi:hypothetical protein